MISLARDWGLDAFLNLSEIEYPDDLVEKFPELSATPPANADRAYRPPTAGGASTLYDRFGVKPNLCISEPKTWEFVEGKVREITELFPEASGIQMSLNGADSDIFFCDCERCRKLDKTQRAKLMFQHVTRGLEHGDGKKLVFRPYMGAWKNLLEPEVYGPLAGSLPPSVVLRHNATYGDTYIFNSLNPLLGALPDNDQLCDFDPGGEYTGGFFGIQHTISRYMAERVRTYVGRRVRNFTFRCLEYRTDFTDLDWFVGSMLAWNPELDVEEMRDIWARRRFGSEAGPQVLALLDLGFDGMRKTH